MNILHMKYAVEVARCGSINKAAETLLMNQPNLSRAIKELELSLGVKIFTRSAKGMVPTPEGETFLRYANTILKQVDEVEAMFQKSAENKKRFSISVPRASYISDAFASFSLSLGKETDAEVFYKETNSARTIKNITEADYRLGIIRYASHFDRYYKKLLEEKGLTYELIIEFQYVLALGRENPLSKKKEIFFEDLEGGIEIAHADPGMPSVPFAEVKKEEHPYHAGRRIYVFERASQFEILSELPDTFMWASPIPKPVLQRYGLIQTECAAPKNDYKDVLVSLKHYQYTETEHIFIEALKKMVEQLRARV